MSKFLMDYKSFQESIKIDISLVEIDINESLGMFYDSIMKSIGAEEVDLYNTFKLNKGEVDNSSNLDLITTNPEFINSLSKNGLKKSNVTNSDDFETFLNKPCKFMLIHKVEASELENPDYIIFQSWNDNLSNWGEIRMFKITGDIKKFYDKLSSKVIEVEESDGKKYIYQTTNGNEWVLQSVDQPEDPYQKYFRKDDFYNVLKDRKVKINII